MQQSSLPDIIHTDCQEAEIWQKTDKLTSLNYVKHLLKCRINNEFFGFGPQINRIDDGKNTFNVQKPDSKKIEIDNPLPHNNIR